MNITSVQTREFHRALSTSMKTSRGEIASRSGIIIAVGGIDDIFGYGEVDFPLYEDDAYGDEITSIKDMLSATLDAIKGLPVPSSLDDITAGLKPLLPARHPAVYFGVETALCDLAAKIVGRPLSRWLYAMARPSVPVNYLVPRPVNDWETMTALVHEHGYRAVKAKVGADSLEKDIKFVSQLRGALGKNIRIRLDANRAWDSETAMAVCNRLKQFDIEYIEEPLADFDIDQLAHLSKRTGVRFALDESLAETSDLNEMLTSSIKPVLILKPARIGGIAKTVSITKQAKMHNCPAVITSNLEIEIGTAALLQVAATAYDDTPPCGLDTMRMFEKPDAKLISVSDGEIELPPPPGLGMGESLWKSL